MIKSINIDFETIPTPPEGFSYIGTSENGQLTVKLDTGEIKYLSGIYTLSDLHDVNISGLTLGQILVWDGENWKNSDELLNINDSLNSLIQSITGNTSISTSIETALTTEISQRIYGDSSLSNEITYLDNSGKFYFYSGGSIYDPNLFERLTNIPINCPEREIHGTNVSGHWLTDVGSFLKSPNGNWKFHFKSKSDTSHPTKNYINIYIVKYPNIELFPEQRIYITSTSKLDYYATFNFSGITLTSSDMIYIRITCQGVSPVYFYYGGTENYTYLQYPKYTNLDTQLSVETSQRISSDNSIYNSLSGLTSATVSLSSALSSETSQRISSDISLSSLISTSPRTLSGLTDVNVSGLTNSDVLVYSTSNSKWNNEQPIDITNNVSNGQLLIYTGDTLSGITNLFPTLSTSISTESSQRILSDSSLNTKISSETSTRIVQVSSLESSILSHSGSTFDPSSLETSISVEESTRISADTSLANAIGSGGGSSSYSGLSYNVITSGGTLNTGATIDFTTSDLYKIDITGNTNIVFDFTNGIIGKTLILVITNSGAGNTTTCSFNPTTCKTIGTYSTVKTNMISVLCVSDTNPKFWVVIGNTTS